MWLLISILLAAFLAGCADRPASTVNPDRTRNDQPTAALEFPSLPSAKRQQPRIVPRFVDAAPTSGIEFTYFNDEVPGRFLLPEVMGGGAAWLDYDGDGRLDLYVMNGCRLQNSDPNQSEHLNRLYRNRAGTFEDVTLSADAHHSGYGQGCAVGDFNADGMPDLYLTNYGTNALFVNNGDGTFSGVTQQAGVGDPSWSTGALWHDIDGDGTLDLYVANYLGVTLENNEVCDYHGRPGYCGPGRYPAVPDRVYLNQGDGTFAEAAEALGIIGEREHGQGLVVAAVDLDHDLKAEIYVGNDQAANYLFTRRPPQPADTVANALRGVSSSAPGPGTSQRAGTPQRPFPTDDRDTPVPLYRETAIAAGCALSGTGENEASMGIACADFDGDGLVDVFLTHYFQKKNTFYRNLGNLLFDDESHRSRIAAVSFQYLGFGTAALDYDRDGAADLFVANGHVLGRLQQPNEMTPQLVKNDGRGRFEDVSEFAGEYFQGKYLGRGVAAADYDNDGDPDVAVSHLDRPLALLRNETNTRGRHWLGLELRTLERIPPVGGRIVVGTGQNSRVVPIVAGGSYLSTHDTRLLVGLGDWEGPAEVQVFWPSGRVDRLEISGVDRYWSILEGKRPEPLP